MYKKFSSYAVLVFLLWVSMLIALPSSAQLLVETGTSLLLTQETSVTAAIPAVSTVVTLNTTARHIKIKSDSGAAVMYVRLDGGTATTANFKIDPGTTQEFMGIPPTAQVTILGASALGNYSIFAW